MRNYIRITSDHAHFPTRCDLARSIFATTSTPDHFYPIDYCVLHIQKKDEVKILIVNMHGGGGGGEGVYFLL